MTFFLFCTKRTEVPLDRAREGTVGFKLTKKSRKITFVKLQRLLIENELRERHGQVSSLPWMPEVSLSTFFVFGGWGSKRCSRNDAESQRSPLCFY